jgi:type II secretory pathway pseudopilin PulG
MRRIMNLLRRKVRQYCHNESGLGLVEMLVAVSLMGLVATAFISALSTGSLAVGTQSEQTIAQQLAQTQQEVIKAAAYSTTGAGYPAVTAPSGYSVAFTVNSSIYSDTNIQKITVTISRDGTQILTTEGYKVNR